MSVPERTKRRLVLTNRRSHPVAAEDGDEVVAAAENRNRHTCALEAKNLCGNPCVALSWTARHEAGRVDVDECGRVALEHTLGQALGEARRSQR